MKVAKIDFSNQLDTHRCNGNDIPRTRMEPTAKGTNCATMLVAIASGTTVRRSRMRRLRTLPRGQEEEMSSNRRLDDKRTRMSLIARYSSRRRWIIEETREVAKKLKY